MRTQPDDGQNARRSIVDALQLSAFGYALVVVPDVAGLDWSRIAADPNIPLVVTNRPSQAVRLCQQGQPAVAIMGASEAAVAKWLRARGANVIDKAGAH